MELKLIYLVSSLNSSEKAYAYELDCAKELAEKLAIRRGGADIYSFLYDPKSFEHVFQVLPTAKFLEPNLMGTKEI